MTIFRRGTVWYYEFKHQGKKYRKSTGTDDEKLAALIEEEAKKKVAHKQFESSPLLSVLLPDVEKRQDTVADTIRRYREGRPVQGDLFCQDVKRKSKIN